MNASEQDSYEYIPYTPRTMRRWIKDSKPTLLIAEETNVIGVIAAEEGWPAGPGEAIISQIAVRTGQDMLQIEPTLIDEIEKRMHVKGLTISLPIGNEQIAKYLQRGFQMDGGFVHMTRTLHGLPPPPTFMKGAIIRGLQRSEEEKFIHLINASYGAQRLDMEEVESWKHNDPLFTDDWIQVAEYRGKLVGAGVARRDMEYNAFYKKKRGYLGPSGTLPEFRGRGLNKAVNWHAMKFLVKQGLDSVSLYTNESNFAVQRLTMEFGYTLCYHWKLLKRKARLSGKEDKQ